ncbi:hypothetical protein CLAFUW4_03825 [Fulvia fulva]|uniref:Uncharacterized protein n=1 Tax=Passalora fulva TaxID=5499 RepID=A0A9Q8LB42_PASFU|nr:uncharacterized protein CLAFUR5_03797 [Fulvia fulva]KAK4630836.1 hypothetical protein CLAFUR4_03813 [Fulvia fulva]KAK4633369.1 hypothetical protein CLAFUR0_03812 [Fulvia fulva]UJO14142.1 hypothetical protein CLAFUR5_03797 [Fulvia fulva]WPV11246.1 hypothetical protein CLAFUW4_03825 [Fulvia fulva]WPV26736.1 hypothetical protein CLAFUW7_03817 [Fulvia fulva]
MESAGVPQLSLKIELEDAKRIITQLQADLASKEKQLSDTRKFNLEQLIKHREAEKALRVHHTAPPLEDNSEDQAIASSTSLTTTHRPTKHGCPGAQRSGLPISPHHLPAGPAHRGAARLGPSALSSGRTRPSRQPMMGSGRREDLDPPPSRTTFRSPWEALNALDDGAEVHVEKDREQEED